MYLYIYMYIYMYMYRYVLYDIIYILSLHVHTYKCIHTCTTFQSPGSQDCCCRSVLGCWYKDM